MAQTLEHNSAVTTVTPVEIPAYDGDVDIIQQLDDEPNDVGGLSAQELKAKFDEAGASIVGFLNDDLIPTIIADDLTEQARAAAEAERVANEIERVGNENTRVTAEGLRVTAENVRVSAENGRVTAETARADAETARVTAETGRAGAEGTRASNETARQTAESGRISAESSRMTAESGRADAEALRVTAETARVAAETARADAETARATAEIARAGAEQTRTSNEETRVSNEQTRVSNEITRQSNESTRQSNEQARQSNETARQDAETGYIAQARGAAQDAEAWAAGQRGGADVPSSDPAYHNNAKYYMEQAAEIVGADYVTRSQIAVIEQSATAEAAHAVGSYFGCNGRFYRATHDHAGDQLRRGADRGRDRHEARRAQRGQRRPCESVHPRGTEERHDAGDKRHGGGLQHHGERRLLSRGGQ